ncbi:hypothetical protein DFS34DRAFT_647527 [Phlyctochytrium arcticum]|nr:hypothetical protein DFS34DRAFT_647527 [Phlyctochytrium arcticum]
MTKNYHCDYCNRSFRYDPEALERHLKSVNHQQLVNLHYTQLGIPRQMVHVANIGQWQPHETPPTSGVTLKAPAHYPENKKLPPSLQFPGPGGWPKAERKEWG